MKVIGSTLAQGQNIRSKQGFDRKLSKTVVLNSTNRIFFYKDAANKSVVSATVAGRDLDFEVFGSSFFCPNDDQLVYDEATQQWKDISGLDDWARIAKVLHAAKAADAKYHVESKAREDANRVGKDVDQVALTSELDKIQVNYFGGKDQQGKPIYPKVKPMVSNLVFKSTTQVLVVPLKESGAPDFDEASTAYLEMSGTKARQLSNLMKNAAYNNPDLPYIEIGFDYTGTTPEEAGRAATFQGISEDTSLKKNYPDVWNERWEGAWGLMVNGNSDEETAELMAHRNIGLCSTTTARDVEACIRKFCASSDGVMASIDMESDDTKKAANLFIKYGLVNEVPKIKASLEELVAELEVEKAANIAEEVAQDEDDQQNQAVMQAVADTEGLHTVEEIASKVNLDAVSGGGEDFEGEM